MNETELKRLNEYMVGHRIIKVVYDSNQNQTDIYLSDLTIVSFYATHDCMQCVNINGRDAYDAPPKTTQS